MPIEKLASRVSNSLIERPPGPRIGVRVLATAGVAVALVLQVAALGAGDQRPGEAIVRTIKADDGYPMRPIVGTGTGVIAGHVLDEVRGRPVVSALVTIGSAVGTMDGGDSRAFSIGFDGQFGAEVLGISSPRAARVSSLPLPRVLTDENGAFVFTDLPPGSYHVAVSKAGFLDGAGGRLRADGEPLPISLREGGRATDLTVWLSRPGAITGLVKDESGEPIVSAPMRAYRRAIRGGATAWIGTDVVADSDDRGVYRLSGLVPGDYLVGMVSTQVSAPVTLGTRSTGELLNTARPLGLGSFQLADGGQHLGGNLGFVAQDAMGLPPMSSSDLAGRPVVYSTRFYPSAIEPSNAQTITVRAGDEHAGIDVSIDARATGSIHGRLMAATGPAPTYALHLIRQDSARFTPQVDDAVAISNQDGEFLFPAVPPGSYRIRSVRASASRELDGLTSRFTSPLFGPPALGGGSTLWIDVPVTVAAGSTIELPLTMTPGVSVAGAVSLESGKPLLPETLWRAARVVLEPAGGVWTSSPTVPSPIGGAGRFEIRDVVPGRYRLRVTGLPAGFSLRAAAAGAPSAMDAVLDIAQDTSNVFVVVSDTMTFLDGSVQRADGRPDTEATILAVPTDAAAWKDYGVTPIALRSQRTDGTGGFVIRGLPAGEYFVIAIAERSAQYAMDPATLERLTAFATRARLEPGHPVTIRLLRHGLDAGVPAATIPKNAATVDPPSSVPHLSAVALAEAGLSAVALAEAGLPAVALAEAGLPAVALAEAGLPAVALAEAGPFAPGAAAQAGPAGGTITGIVREADSAGRPLGLARVAVRGASLDHEWATTTNPEGRFQLTGLPFGRFTIEVTKPAYLAQRYGAAPQSRGLGVPLALDATQPSRDIEIALTRGAAIEGTIRNDTADPVFLATVRVLRVSPARGSTVPASPSSPPVVVATTMTDDRGNYRVFGLEPGNYIVAAMPQALTYANTTVRMLAPEDVRAALSSAPPPAPPNTSVPGQAVQYMPAYYLDSTYEPDATPIVLEAGQERRAVDLTARLVLASRIEGRVVARNGGAVANVSVRLINQTASHAFSAQRSLPSDGRFAFVGVPPGRYVIAATGHGDSVRTVSWARATVDVNGTDVTGLQLALEEGVRISGRVVAAGGNSGATPPDLSGVRIQLRPADGISVDTQTAQTANDGTFTIVVPEGTYSFESSQPRNREWMVKSASFGADSPDVQGQSFVVSATMRALTVTITRDITEITGKLMDAQGAPVAGVHVMVLPADHALWTASSAWSSRMGTPEITGADGRYSITRLPPGDYVVAAIPVATAALLNPLFLEQVAAAGVAVTIGDAEKKTVDLRIK